MDTQIDSNVEKIYGSQKNRRMKFPIFVAKIHAGFPSPADDFVDKKLDLNDYLISHPISTFFVRVKGESMINAGIFNGDILIVDKAVDAQNNKIVIAYVNNEFTVKRYCQIKGKTFLVAENPDFKPIEIKQGMEFQIWGVVTTVIHQV